MTSKIEVNLTRDSVCMGDDMEDHTKVISFIQLNNTADTLMHIATQYLPKIDGYGHIWDCILNGVKCAEIKGNCITICVITNDFLLEKNDLYFKYHSATH